MTYANAKLPFLFSTKDSAGAGHAGRGGHGTESSSPGQAYGSVRQPRSHGSGSLSSSGGGVIRLSARGSINIDGLVTANGEDSATKMTGGASGGSVWMSALSLSGNGAVRTSGGRGGDLGGGGGGGRISIEFDNSTFGGKIEAFGGQSVNESGGAGTILFYNKYKKTTKLLVDNNNIGAPVADDIRDVLHDGGRTWLTPESNTTVMAFDEVSFF